MPNKTQGERSGRQAPRRPLLSPALRVLNSPRAPQGISPNNHCRQWLLYVTAFFVPGSLSRDARPAYFPGIHSGGRCVSYEAAPAHRWPDPPSVQPDSLSKCCIATLLLQSRSGIPEREFESPTTPACKLVASASFGPPLRMKHAFAPTIRPLHTLPADP